MNAKLNIASVVVGGGLFLSTAQASTHDETTLRAVGAIIENPSDHTTRHDHSLKFLNLLDGQISDIVDSPELIKSHCESGQKSVVEITGSRTGKFLFWGGNLVVTDFRIHPDIEAPRLAHTSPPRRVQRSGGGRSRSRSH
jgi:hypothetical protein